MNKIIYNHKKEEHLKGSEISKEKLQQLKNKQIGNLEQKERTVIVPTMTIMDENQDIKEVEIETHMYEVEDKQR
ncbi:hypothetical protein OW763_02595 [Clostridium aestuarii]|uniref:DUF2382 domain-containing protein n=1 Tax=Clostridium aestuarii TaxID=338193 RepID=A0ABT4CW61_9CLOT|nr:hypothetical protein [Clostridium aestuarii]MCY6483244.1 hypothetical protein [Clostridium aestuarii]